MALTQKLLDRLVCPSCKEKLDYEEKDDHLVCNKCVVAYRITENIPVLLADEAQKL